MKGRGRWRKQGLKTEHDEGHGKNNENKEMQLIPQPGDGSCLFHSLVYGLSGRASNEKVSRELRRDIVDFIRKHPEHEINGDKK